MTTSELLNKHGRKRMILAMEYIARHVNDEELFWDNWSIYGVADGDIPYGSFDTNYVEDNYIEDENYKDICNTFLWLMKQAFKRGGLTEYFKI